MTMMKNSRKHSTGQKALKFNNKTMVFMAYSCECHRFLLHVPSRAWLIRMKRKDEKNTMSDIRRFAYELYKYDWRANNSELPHTDLQPYSDKCNADFHFTNKPAGLFTDMFLSFESFLATLYQNTDYMKYLLLPYDLFVSYEADFAK